MYRTYCFYYERYIAMYAYPAPATLDGCCMELRFPNEGRMRHFCDFMCAAAEFDARLLCLAYSRRA